MIMLKKLRHYADTVAAVAGAFAVALAIFFAARETAVPEKNPLEGGKYVIALDFGHFKIKSDILYAGLCYEMIKDFTAENGCEASITSYTSRACGIDSLRSRTVDIVLMPLSDSIRHRSHIDSVAFSRKVRNGFRWVVRQEDKNLLPTINSWLKDYTNRDSFDGMLERFRFMPSSSRPPKEFKEQKRLSPYDEIIKFRADSIGWDWRLLAAVIYTESKFAINVASPAGAKGLMQIMPLTAKVYNVENPLDPSENIRAGASYLGRLDKTFRKVPPEDRIRYVLAAYNAGESRILSRMKEEKPESNKDTAGKASETDPAETEDAAVAAVATNKTETEDVVATTDVADSADAVGKDDGVDSADGVADTEQAQETVQDGGNLSAGDAEQTETGSETGTDFIYSAETWLENAYIYVGKVLRVYNDFCRICPE